jgi:ParB family chromosome partitioning protein
VTKRHDAMLDDVLSDLDAGETARPPERFLRRAMTMAEQAGGQRQEKVLRLVDPATCVMWAGHNRAYDQLTEANCRDLIDGLLAQGQQEFPAIVRRLAQPQGQVTHEVICGARRHFAVTWLRAHNYPQFRYLIEERELTDEEAFRLADIENRDRQDISDYERARDYLSALDRYYEGKQAAMAQRLQVSTAWLSRYLALARIEYEIIGAFAAFSDVKELHVRQLKPLMAGAEARRAILAEAEALMAEQARARAGQGSPVPVSQVLSRLKSAAQPPKERTAADRTFARSQGEAGVQMRRKGSRVALEFSRSISDDGLRAAVESFLEWRARGQ